MDNALRTVEVPDLSRIDGLTHGFLRRSLPTGAETRDETRARVRRALETRGELHLLHQTHGTTLHEAPWTGRPEGDCAVARAPGLILGIETADCLPVLLVDPARRFVGAAHAGWRGTAARIAVRTLEALERLGTRREDVHVALGPCIGPCCYEVGEELRSAFGGMESEVFTLRPNGRSALDIRLANANQLRACGLSDDRIHQVRECTACRPELYHSYRRDGVGGGRMISFVGFEAR